MLLFAIIINVIIELSLLICTYPHNLSREAYCKYTNEISEHGAFPLVSVRVQHGEPGNMHPYNFEPIFYQKPHFEHIIVRNPKTTDSMTVQHECSTCWMIVE